MKEHNYQRENARQRSGWLAGGHYGRVQRDH
jgi:hypothetical protein